MQSSNSRALLVEQRRGCARRAVFTLLTPYDYFLAVSYFCPWSPATISGPASLSRRAVGRWAPPRVT